MVILMEAPLGVAIVAMVCTVQWEACGSKFVGPFCLTYMMTIFVGSDFIMRLPAPFHLYFGGVYSLPKFYSYLHSSVHGLPCFFITSTLLHHISTSSSHHYPLLKPTFVNFVWSLKTKACLAQIWIYKIIGVVFEWFINFKFYLFTSAYIR